MASDTQPPCWGYCREYWGLCKLGKHVQIQPMVTMEEVSPRLHWTVLFLLKKVEIWIFMWVLNFDYWTNTRFSITEHLIWPWCCGLKIKVCGSALPKSIVCLMYILLYCLYFLFLLFFRFHLCFPFPFVLFFLILSFFFHLVSICGMLCAGYWGYKDEPTLPLCLREPTA